MKKTSLLFVLFPAITLLAGCNPSGGSNEKTYFSLWNEVSTQERKSPLTVLKEYVKKVTDKNNTEYFIPVEDRIATFDMDGTFIGELYPTYFEYNLLEYRALDDPNYKDIAPVMVKEVAQEIRDFVRYGVPLPEQFDLRHAHAAAKAYEEMSLKEFDQYVKEYAQKTPNGFSGMTYLTSFYKPMLEVFDYLNDYGFTNYVVSGSDRFICRSLVESIGIPSNHVIGMDVTLKSSGQGYSDGVNYDMKSDEEVIRTDELIIKNLKTNKVKQIAQEIGKVPVLSFGNSSGDVAMHNYCKGNKKYHTEVFMLIADDEQEDHVNMVETRKREQKWKDNNYNIISMKDDFKTVYGYDVQKIDFSWSSSDVNKIEYSAFHEATNLIPTEQYSKAYLDLVKEVTTYSAEGEPIVSTDTEQYIATYNSETHEWSIDIEDPVIDSYTVFVETKAKDLDQSLAIFNQNLYQKLSATYYSSNSNYRFRYIASGQSVVSEKEINLYDEGCRLYNTHGDLYYYEDNLTTKGDNVENKITTKTQIYISYEA